MAAPPNINLKSLDTTSWTMNSSLSDNYDSILKLQGVNWLMRKIMNSASVAVTMKEWVVAGITHLDIQNKPNSGLPGTTENRVLNWEPTQLNHPLFGKVRGRTRWIKVDGVEEEYQKLGWEDGTEEVIQMFTDHISTSTTTSQVCGFEVIDGVRRHTRRLVVKNGDAILEMRLVYDYLGSIGFK